MKGSKKKGGGQLIITTGTDKSPAKPGTSIELSMKKPYELMIGTEGHADYLVLQRTSVYQFGIKVSLQAVNPLILFTRLRCYRVNMETTYPMSQAMNDTEGANIIPWEDKSKHHCSIVVPLVKATGVMGKKSYGEVVEGAMVGLETLITEYLSWAIGEGHMYTVEEVLKWCKGRFFIHPVAVQLMTPVPDNLIDIGTAKPKTIPHGKKH